ncbi:hypothetical protein [Pseudomonas aeruginosa]|uniref:hypothetical protein n=1 Tax=Pseudomonas aeruginosa TaxID=287 RepID=UPI00301C0B22
MTGLEYLFVALVMAVVSYAITLSMAPKPEKPVAGQLDVPTAEEGGCIPVCFGKNIIKQSNVIWYGVPSVEPIKTKGGKK